jgi:hypothetical protein
MQLLYKHATRCIGYLLLLRSWCDLFVIMSWKTLRPSWSTDNGHKCDRNLKCLFLSWLLTTLSISRVISVDYGMINECRAVDGMRTGKEKRNTRTNLAPQPPCPWTKPTLLPASEHVHSPTLFIRGMFPPQFINWLMAHVHAHSCKYKC